MLNLLQSSYVKRWHTTPILGEQNIGHHTFRMLLLAFEVTEPSIGLLTAIVYHDVAEMEVSDVSYTTKIRWPKIHQGIKDAERDFADRHNLHIALTDEEHTLLRFLDMAEAVAYGLDQLRLGNRHMHVVCERGLDFLEDLPHINDKCDELLAQLGDGYEREC